MAQIIVLILRLKAISCDTPSIIKKIIALYLLGTLFKNWMSVENLVLNLLF
jgi:hypothetical protein